MKLLAAHLDYCGKLQEDCCSNNNWFDGRDTAALADGFSAFFMDNMR